MQHLQLLVQVDQRTTHQFAGQHKCEGIHEAEDLVQAGYKSEHLELYELLRNVPGNWEELLTNVEKLIETRTFRGDKTQRSETSQQGRSE